MKSDIIFIEENDKEYRVLIGQSAEENVKIIKTSKQNDIWFHLQSTSSPHIILQNGGDPVPKRVLYQIGKKIFENKKKALKNQGVIYTEVKNVKLTEVPGSVISKHVKVLNFF